MLAMIKFVPCSPPGKIIFSTLFCRNFSAFRLKACMKALKATYSGECFPVVGHIARYGDSGGGRGAARSRWKAGPSVLVARAGLTPSCRFRLAVTHVHFSPQQEKSRTSTGVSINSTAGHAFYFDFIFRRGRLCSSKGGADPHILKRGYRTPTFWAYDRKNNSNFPSSSNHVSPYNIQENFWRLRLCPRNRVWAHIAPHTSSYLRNRISTT